MNCKECHHTHEAHVDKREDDGHATLMKAGSCIIPACRCRQYVDPINEIDEELL